MTVTGTPTGVFAQVARGALGCWFGGAGRLKASHVYRAEAEPPAKGGAAEIIVYERDASLRDQRGGRAYHIAFTAEGGSSVKVATTALKFESALAMAMAKDVEAWARGAASCQLGTLLPPPPPPGAKKVAKPTKPTKGKQPASNKKR
jgi:hypothetical protein